MAGLLDTIKEGAEGLLGIRPSDVLPQGLLPENSPSVDDVDRLARIMIAEAEMDGREGMQMVGNVVWNRMHDTNPVHGFKNQKTIQDVIEARNQFSGYREWHKKGNPVFDKYENAHKSERWDQAKVLAGHQLMGNLEDITGGRVFYRNPKTAQKSGWFEDNYQSKNLQPGKRIGNHMLYDWVEDRPDTWKKEGDIKAIKTAYSDL